MNQCAGAGESAGVVAIYFGLTTGTAPGKT